MPSALVSINGRPLFVEIEGAGPPLIAMHGLGGNTNLFPIAPELAMFFTVIRFDFEGAGKSPLQGELTMKGFVQDCKAVLEHAGFEGVPARIFGHSLGAAVALHFASSYPALVASLILSCPSLPRKGDPAGEAASAFLAETARSKGPLNMADFTAQKNVGPDATLVMKGLIRMAMQESDAEGYARACEMMGRTGAPDWEKIRARTLIFAGNHDQISSVDQAEKVAKLLTNAEYVNVIPLEAGHQPAVEVPDEVLSKIKSFLGV